MMKHLGDITKISGYTAPVVDCIIGGSPCQDLSVAGKRKGLQHADLGDEETTRSGLFMEQIRIAKEMRDNDKRNGRSGVDIRPAYFVWENVCGALNSNSGEDFRCVLEEVCRIADPKVSIPGPADGKWQNAGCIVGEGTDGTYSVCWRVLNAQHYGVPQRRRRIALMASFGNRSACDILFEKVLPLAQGVSRYPQPGAEKGQRVREKVSDSVQSSAPSIGFQERAVSAEHQGEPVVAYSCAYDGTQIAPTLTKQNAGGNQRMPDKDNFNCVVQAYGISSYDSNAMKSSNPESGFYPADTARTLDNNGGNPACNQGGTAVCYRKTAHPANADQPQGWEPASVCDTLNVYDNSEARTPTLVCAETYHISTYQDPAPTLKQRDYKDPAIVCYDARGNGNGDVARRQMNDRRKQICYTEKRFFEWYEDDKSVCIRAKSGSYGGGSEVLVTEDKSIGVDIYNLAETGDVAASVTDRGMTNAEGSGPRVCYCIGNGQANDVANPEKISKTLNCLADPMKVLVNKSEMIETEPEYIVRRLTPLETERLQGYPSFLDFDVARMSDDEYAACCAVFNTKIKDKQTILDYSAGGYIRALCARGIGIARVYPIVHERGWTDIGEWTDTKGKKHKPADAPKYKAIGNSIAIPCWRFIAQGIRAQYDHPITMASLFDGIGGFPLVWEEVNGKGSAVWASEIEEFPIAVTKIRFPEEDA